jgi:glycosyltransferase involved in cell wall biosynthesis
VSLRGSRGAFHRLAQADPGQPTVLFVSAPVGVGGSTRSMANLLTYMDGHARRVLAGPPNGRFHDLVGQLGAADVYLPMISSERPRPPRRALSAIKLAIFARRNRKALAVMHANGLKEMSLSICAAALSGVPLVVWVHEFNLPPSVLRLGRLWRVLLRRIDVQFATVSPLSRDLVARAGLVDADDVEVVPNPIDPADVLARPRAEDDPDPDAGDERVRVAFLGTPLGYKGFQYLPDMVRLTTAEAPVRWLIFSRQTEETLDEVWEELRAMAATHPVSIEGKFTDVAVAYARCDIVVVPSELESFCRVAAEAMLNGIPVVGSDLEPVRALLGDEQAGILFPVGDVHAASKAVVRLATDENLRAELGREGCRRAEAFSPAVVGAQFREIYRLGSS